MTAKALAEASGLSARYVLQAEHGDAQPRPVVVPGGEVVDAGHRGCTVHSK